MQAQFKYESALIINCMKSRCLSEINIRVNLHFYGHPHFYFHKYQYPARLRWRHIVCIATTIHQEVLHFWNCVNFSLCWRKLSFCPYHRLFDHGSVSPTLPTVLYTLIVFISQVTKVDVQHACGLDKYFLNDKAWILSEKHTGLKEERWIIFVKGKKLYEL